MSASQSKHIVVGVDGSPPSVQALKWAFGQAILTGSEIDAVCAWHYPNTLGMGITDGADYQAFAEETLAKAIAEARTATTTTPPCRSTRSSSTRSPRRPCWTRPRTPSLLVVGFRGHGGLSEALLGSVSQHVAHHAPCPVVIIRDGVA